MHISKKYTSSGRYPCVYLHALIFNKMKLMKYWWAQNWLQRILNSNFTSRSILLKSSQLHRYSHMENSEIPGSWTLHAIIIALMATNNEIMTISNTYSHGRITDTKLMNISCNCHSFNTNNKETNNNYEDHDNSTDIFTWNIQRHKAHEHFMQLL